MSGTVAESARILPVTVTPESVVANLVELLKNNETAPPDKAVIWLSVPVAFCTVKLFVCSCKEPVPASLITLWLPSWNIFKSLSLPNVILALSPPKPPLGIITFWNVARAAESKGCGNLKSPVVLL